MVSRFGSVLVMVVLMLIFSAVNYYISIAGPNADIKEAAQTVLEKRKMYPLKQDQVMYTEVLNKIGSCKKATDMEGNEFYTCPDGSTVSMVRWSRDQGERKGVVTKYYNKEGTQLLQYGHPDDVH